MTGSTFFSNLLTSKRLGLLLEMIPTVRSIATLVNPENANAQFQISETKSACHALNLQTSFLQAATRDEIDRVFDELHEQKPHALLILSDSFLNGRAALFGFAQCYSDVLRVS